MFSKLKPKSEFSRNVLTLMTGTTIAQAIPIAISPILTRLYTPEDFGVFALYLSITSILFPIVTGRYELAILLPKKDEYALQIMYASAFITLIVFFTSISVIFLFHQNILELLNNQDISHWLYLIPLSVLLFGFFQIFNYWYNRNKSYKELAKNKIIQSTSVVLINIIGYYITHSVFGLIVGNIFGFFVVNIRFFYLFFKNKKFEININIKKVKILLKKYKKFPMYNMPNALIDQFRMNGINLLIVYYFSNALLGQFYMAFRMLQAPMGLVGTSLSQVFVQKIASSERSEIYGIVYKFITKSLLLVFPLFFFLYFYVADIFIFIFGDKWNMAGDIASLLVPWIFVNFISSPISSVFIVLHHQEKMLIFSVLYALAPILIIYFEHTNFLLSIKYISWIMTFLLIVFILGALYLAKKEVALKGKMT